ncbi:hypothetical protein HDU97_005446 [Phlyctochytrium planicorne]|nr:hypothetical protein HDU97_005446 [Phlyctochytrium planicorne]
MSVLTQTLLEPPPLRPFNEFKVNVTADAYFSFSQLMPSTSFTGFTPSCTNREAWSPLLNTTLGTTTIKTATNLLKSPFPPFVDSLYLLYYQTGNRGQGETMLKARYNAIYNLVLAECLEWQGRFLPMLNEGLVSIANQRSWVLPAHDTDAATFYGKENIIDLGSATLSAQLTQYYLMLNPILNAKTNTDMIQALTNRTIAPTLQIVAGKKAPFWWMSASSNWNAVCFAGVSYTVLALVQDQTQRNLALAYILKASSRFMDSYLWDGFAVEGVAYYNYGFGFYCYLREVILAYSGNVIDIFARDGTPNMALFPFRFAMTSNLYAQFGDASIDTLPSQLLNYIRWSFNLTSTVPTLPPFSDPNLQLLYLFPSQFKKRQPVTNLAAFADGKDEPMPLRSVFGYAATAVLRDGPQRKEGEGISRLDVTFKNGGNGGHSHNDIGSYVVAIDGVILAGDPGGPLIYNSSTFSDDRYDSPLMNSVGHPVPLFYKGTTQLKQFEATKLLASLPTKKFTIRPTFKNAVDTIFVDLTKAYFSGSSNIITRNLTYTRGKEGKICVMDVADVGYAPRLFTSWDTAITSTATIAFHDGLLFNSSWKNVSLPYLTGTLTAKNTTLKFTIMAGAGDAFANTPLTPWPPAPDRSVKMMVKMERFLEYGKSFARIGIQAKPVNIFEQKVGIMVVYEAI